MHTNLGSLNDEDMVLTLGEFATTTEAREPCSISDDIILVCGAGFSSEFARTVSKPMRAHSIWKTRCEL
jgi:hypothetical protein